MATKRLMTLFIALVISGFAFGQNVERNINQRTQRTPEEIAKVSSERLSQKLQLSADQQKEIYALTLEQAKKAEERKEINQSRREEMLTERNAQQEKFKSILTPEQLKTFNDSRASVRNGNNRRGDFRKGPSKERRDSVRSHQHKNNNPN
jgi:protein CpxP